MDDMILDMDNFDFSQLDSDLVVVHPDAPAEEVVEDTEDYEEVAEEAEEEAEDDVEVEAEEEGSDDDVDQEVEFENYEITLPSGEAVVLSDLVQGYKNAEEVRVLREEVESVKREFEEKSGNAVHLLELAQLETDSVIAEYDDTDWEELSKEDPHAYAQHRTYLDKHVARSKELKSAMSELQEKKVQEEQAAEQEKVKNAIVRLQREIPGWGPEKYKNLVGYAVSLGADEAELHASADPLVFLALNKAMEFEKGKQSVKAKLKKVGSPKKVVKAAAAKPSTSKNASRDALLKRAEETGDMALMFSLLED